MKKLIGAVTCWWRGHHINGNKRRSTAAERQKEVVTTYVYQCSRCGRLSSASMPVKRVKK